MEEELSDERGKGQKVRDKKRHWRNTKKEKKIDSSCLRESEYSVYDCIIECLVVERCEYYCWKLTICGDAFMLEWVNKLHSLLRRWTNKGISLRLLRCQNVRKSERKKNKFVFLQQKKQFFAISSRWQERK